VQFSRFVDGHTVFVDAPEPDQRDGPGYLPRDFRVYANVGNYDTLFLAFTWRMTF
jgi:hypothetical protein